MVLKVKFDQVGAVMTGQHGVEGSAKWVDRVYVIGQRDDDSAYAVAANNDIQL